MKLKDQREKPAINLNMGYLPPQASELENAIIGAIMVDKTAYDNVAEVLTPDCFYKASNQRVFKAIQSLAAKNQPIDMLTVVNELKTFGDFEQVGGFHAIIELTKSVVSGANIVAHSRIVLQKFIAREVIRVAGEMISGAYDESVDVFELLDKTETDVLNLGSNISSGEMIPMSRVLALAMQKIEEYRLSDGSTTGVPTGFDELNKATRGWQPGDLIILGARPSVGKTALALNFARNAAADPHKPTTVAMWSLEMKAVYLALRLLAAESEIYMHRLQTGKLEEHHMKQLISKGFDALQKLPIFFDDGSSVSLRTVASKARRLKKKNKLGLIIIDYLQLMSGAGGEGNREQEVSKISRGLKNLAMELEVPIIALSQLTRESEKFINWNHGPSISSLRESGAIEQDADMIILLWGATESEIAEDGDLDGKRKIKIAKQRNGVLTTIELNFRNEIQLFGAIDNQLGGNFKPVHRDITEPQNADSEARIFITSRPDNPDDLPF